MTESARGIKGNGVFVLEATGAGDEGSVSGLAAVKRPAT